MSNPLYQQTGNEIDLLKNLVDIKLSNLNTGLPCRVISSQFPKVTVQVLTNRIFITDNQQIQYVPLGTLSGVPIMTWGNAECNITLPPPSPGDLGVLKVMQNNISQVYDTGEKLNPRKFDLADAVFIPNFMQTIASPDGTITINTTKINIAATTEADINAPTVKINSTLSTEINTPTFKVTNETTELLTAILAALTAIKNGVTESGGGFNSGTQDDIQAAITLITSFTL